MNNIIGKKYTVLIAFAVLTVLLFSILISTQSHANVSPTTSDEAVKAYLDLMATEQFNNEYFSTGATGVDIESLKETFPGDNRTSVFKRQFEFVKSLFGTDAWVNATYTLTPVRSPEVKEQWVEKATGQVISEEVGRHILKQYWDNVALREGVNPQELFADRKVSGEITDPRVLKIIQIEEQYASGEPIEIQLVPYYDSYKVEITFNGIDQGPNGEYNFHINISNKQGKWTIYDGLQWEVVPEEPAGDV
jgi:hypothetical protein